VTGHGLRGRQIARGLLLAVAAIDVLVVLLFAAAPHGIGPMFVAPPLALGLPLGSLIVAIGIALHLGGLAWMVRILRADPEGHASSFRATRH
jgi:hypothetical protein